MTKRDFDRGAWVDMFDAIGLDEATMDPRHHGFEVHWPDDHERLPAWPGAQRDARVRDGARSAPGHP